MFPKMRSTWRVIPLSQGAGTEQMAIDSWLLDQHVRGLQPPTLRFYTWSQPTISLGYHQRQFPEHWNNLSYQGESVALVRRPTGGRAVLHQGDLTYALVTSGVSGSRRAVYERLCQFLIEAWKMLGIELGFGLAGRGYIKNPNCFGTATTADLVMRDGYKLIGSAQVYRERCVLQHGSIRLRPDSNLYLKVFGERITQPKIPPSLASTGLTSTEGLNKIVLALTAAAQRSFGVEFESQAMTVAAVKESITHWLTKSEMPST